MRRSGLGLPAGPLCQRARTVTCSCGVVTTPKLTMVAPAAFAPSATSWTSSGELARVSEPMTMTVETAAMAASTSTSANRVDSGSSAALTNGVATASQSAASIEPSGSTSLTPLSGAGLCDAVTMTPVAWLSWAYERNAARTPHRSMAAGSVSAGPRNPSVPYLSGLAG